MKFNFGKDIGIDLGTANMAGWILPSIFPNRKKTPRPLRLPGRQNRAAIPNVCCAEKMWDIVGGSTIRHARTTE